MVGSLTVARSSQPRQTCPCFLADLTLTTLIHCVRRSFERTMHVAVIPAKPKVFILHS